MVGNKAPLIIGVVFGLLAMLMVHNYINDKQRELTEGMDLVEIIAAADGIPAGTPLSTSMLTTRKIPQKFAPKNAVTPSQRDDIIGQRILTPLEPGDPLVWSNFVDMGIGEKLSDVIKEGERAYTMPCDILSSINGFLRPDDHIDIIGTFADPSDGTAVTLTLLQNVTILAAGDNRQGPGSSRRSGPMQISTVTILVTPEEAMMLTLAQQMGGLTFMLRNSEDINTDQEFRRIKITDIIAKEEVKKVQKKRNRRIIEVIKGGQRIHTGE